MPRRSPFLAAAFLLAFVGAFVVLVLPPLASRFGAGSLRAVIADLSEGVPSINAVLPWFSASPDAAPVGAAALHLSITDDGTDAAPGETLTYVVTVDAGNDAVLPLSVSLSDPTLFSDVSVPPDADYDEKTGSIDWGAVFVPAGGIALRFDVTVSKDAPVGVPFSALVQSSGEYRQDTTVVEMPASKNGCIGVTVSAFTTDGSLYAGNAPELLFAADSLGKPPSGDSAPSSFPAKRVDAGHWKIPSVPAGSYVVRAATPAGWVISGGEAVAISVAGGDPCALVEFSVKKQSSAPAFSLRLSPSQNTIRRGETISVSVTATNTAAETSAAGEVSLSLTSPLVLAAGSNASWPFPALAPGQSRTFAAAVEIDPAAESLPSNMPLVLSASAPGISAAATIFAQPLGSCIVVKKELSLPDGAPFTEDPRSFGFSVILDGVQEQLLDRNGATMFFSVTPGPHAVKERFVPGWNPDGVSPPAGVVTVREGECKTMTFKNVRQPPLLSLALQIAAVPEHAPEPGVVLPGGLVHYAVMVRNASAEDRPATGMSVAVALPSSVQYVGGAGDTRGAYVPASRTVEWEGLVIPPGISTLWFDATVSSSAPAGESLEAKAMLGGPETAPVIVTSSLRVAATAQPDGCLEIAQDVLPPLSPDGTPLVVALPGVLPFEFHVLGPSTGGAPKSVTVTAVSAAGSPPVGTGDQPVARGSAALRGFLPGTYLVAARPQSGFAPAIGTGESADAPYRTVDVAPGEPCAVAAFRTRPVSGQPRFAVTKTDNQQTAVPGQLVTSLLTVRNVSDVPAGEITVTDVLPASLLFDSIPADPPGRYDSQSRTVTWTIPFLPPGATVPLRMSATVDPALPAEVPVTINTTATVEYEGVSGGTATDTTVIARSPAPVTGCIRVVTRGKTAKGTEPFPQVPVELRLDNNDVVKTANPYGIAVFDGVPVGDGHTLTQIFPARPGPFQWKEISMSPRMVTVVPDACVTVTVVNAEVFLPLMTRPVTACGDGLCAAGSWMSWPESCESCPADCGICPVTSKSASAMSVSAGSAASSVSSSSVSSDSSVSFSSASSLSSLSSLSSDSSSPSPDHYYCSYIFPDIPPGPVPFSLTNLAPLPPCEDFDVQPLSLGTAYTSFAYNRENMLGNGRKSCPATCAKVRDRGTCFLPAENACAFLYHIDACIAAGGMFFTGGAIGEAACVQTCGGLCAGLRR